MSGSFNSAIGFQAGFNNGSGNYNTLLGCTATVQSGATRLNCTAVGANTIVPGSNQLILGGNTIGTTHNDVNVGIGLSGDNTGANGLGYEGPAVKLEINADANSFAYTSAGSGLRFRQLTTANDVTANPGPGLLSVTEDGDVIYVEDIGNYCNETPQRALRADYEIPLYDNIGMTGHDYYFTGSSIGVTDIIVGEPVCGTNPIPSSKFQSYQLMNQGVPSYAGYFKNSTDDKTAVGALGISDASQNINFGLQGFVREYRGKSNYGVLGATIPNPAALIGNINIGVYGYANLNPDPAISKRNYAVVGDLGPMCAACTSGTAGGFLDFAGYFNGDLFTTAGFYTPSDSTLKENIQDITNPMDIINSLNPKSYTFKQQGNESMHLSSGTHYGLLAQNIALVLPFAVKDCIHPARYDSLGNQTHDEIDFKGVNNLEIIPFLIAAVKEQEQTIEAMQAEIATLNGGGNRQNHHSGEEENSSDEEQGTRSSIDVELQNAKSIILNQNVPNPFAEQTTITYFLTDDVKKAQMFFYDNKGTILKTVDINEKGEGQINVFAADLSSGNYTYTLVADGKVMDTKKMIKTN